MEYPSFVHIRSFFSFVFHLLSFPSLSNRLARSIGAESLSKCTMSGIALPAYDVQAAIPSNLSYAPTYEASANLPSGWNEESAPDPRHILFLDRCV